jgi:hypothetical protein
MVFFAKPLVDRSRRGCFTTGGCLSSKDNRSGGYVFQALVLLTLQAALVFGLGFALSHRSAGLRPNPEERLRDVRRKHLLGFVYRLALSAYRLGLACFACSKQDLRRV